MDLFNLIQYVQIVTDWCMVFHDQTQNWILVRQRKEHTNTSQNKSTTELKIHG